MANYIPFFKIENQSLTIYGQKNAVENPFEYIKSISNRGFNKIIIDAFSSKCDDLNKDKNLTFLRNIVRNSDIPVIGTGACKRLEDVKKLLYAGCKAAAVNISGEDKLSLLDEASKRFSKNRIYAAVYDKKLYEENKERIYDCAGAVLVPNEDDSLCGIIKADFTEKYGNTDSLYFTVSGIAINDFKYKAEIDCKYKWSDFKVNSDGHVPVIVQDYKTDMVLMLAYMNEEAFNKTVETGIMTYFSRSRNALWIKGETSGHYQYVKSMTADCDMDTILVKVKQIGNACHTGSYSCFFNEAFELDKTNHNAAKVFEDVYATIIDRKNNPKEGSYTNYLFDKGIDKILKKVGEEATEIVIAAKNPDKEEIKYEIADFLYHVMVLMVENKVTWEDITEELANR